VGADDDGGFEALRFKRSHRYRSARIPHVDDVQLAQRRHIERGVCSGEVVADAGAYEAAYLLRPG
jgi:hypothetical protein